MTIDQVISWLFWGLAAVGITLVLVRLRRVRKARQRLAGQSASTGPWIVTKIHIRENGVKLWIFGVILLLGVIQVIPHVRLDLAWWIATLLVISVPIVMILALLAADRDSEEAVATHDEAP